MKALKKLYAEQKHTIYELFNMTGLSHYTLYAYCKHPEKIRKMSIDILEKIAKAEGVDPLWLRGRMLDYVDTMEKEK